MHWTRAKLDDHLSRRLEPVLSSRRTAAVAVEAVWRLSIPARGAALDLFEIAAAANEEIAFQFLLHVQAAVDRRGIQGLQGWLLEILDRYDRDGMYPAIAYLRTVGEGEATAVGEVALAPLAGRLETFLAALGGERHAIIAGVGPTTDGDHLILPERFHLAPTAEDNRTLYRWAATLLWAQLHRATFRLPSGWGDSAVDDLGRLDHFLSSFADPPLAAHLYLLAETVRLEAALGRELPGLARAAAAAKGALLATDLGRDHALLPPRARLCASLTRWLLGGNPGEAATVAHLLTPLATDSATVAASCAAVTACYPHLARLPGDGAMALPYLAALQPKRVAEALRRQRQQRLARLRVAIAHLAAEQSIHPPEKLAMRARTPSPSPTYELVAEGRPVELSAEVEGQLQAVVADLPTLPPELLAAGGWAPGYDPATPAGGEPVAGAAGDGFFYDEWDHRRHAYHKGWCTVREKAPAASPEPVAARILAGHRGVVRALRARFERLRTEERTLRRRHDGTDIDLDAVVEAIADARAGVEPDNRLFTRLQRDERNIAVCFLVDMSGSTKGWINRLQKESLVVLCEAIEAAGDRYAIYGFSGMTRLRCDLYPIKPFSEPYGEVVRARIGAIEPQDYTRMGAAIRHACFRLGEVEARTRLLIALTDGKPDDWDHYRGTYGIEDTRQALIEARRQGVHPFCITLDRDAADYLAHMVGPASYCYVEDVRTLPRKIPEVYRRLTR
ncbi:MAG: hypothetical protein COW73_07580 [Nitrospirae bacterium CG18_big_fil_WC_8_21_14_2_50_70_55]|nr:hypothetical protein [Deltaproteobacteria bacterium]OIP65913.1 MAG: hypothetical protein AUK30_03685 [Nitrospirae bacterium CG2_30_70_394]PIQ04647.1 MAG: hypothetical protein COW73_07580 [Nitrospirae bacterium CG18_big_fil_WC_8_21_14_2_50_70_55]